MRVNVCHISHVNFFALYAALSSQNDQSLTDQLMQVSLSVIAAMPPNRFHDWANLLAGSPKVQARERPERSFHLA